MDETMESLERFYEQVEAEVRRVAGLHGVRLHCRLGCCSCCVDELTVFEVEAEQIRRRYGSLLRDTRPHSEGACAFLDEDGACRIYEHRPYVCRTQGLPLRWIEEGPEDELYEMRDVCPMNEADCGVLDLEPEECWTIGPFEEKLQAIQLLSHEGSLKRCALRSLFRKR